MTAQILTARTGDIGRFQVQRILPAIKRRTVGPFIFLDQMGPTELGIGEGLDVLPHPHIGLSTLTYLFEGSIVHRDSLGNELEIKPGAVNWMTAGRGIVHSERSSPESRRVRRRLHGLQIWIALPREQEESEPAFAHYPDPDIPEVEGPGWRMRVVAGNYAGQRSPVQTSSALVLLDLQLEKGASLSVEYPAFELGLYAISGHYKCPDRAEAGESFAAGQMLLPGVDRMTVECEASGRLILLGGLPLPESRYIDWNFVSSRKERIAEARQLWQEQRFPAVPGETEFVPILESC